jgi:hypothetical protein
MRAAGRIGLLDRSASSGRGIFAAERPFDLTVYYIVPVSLLYPRKRTCAVH